MCFLLLLLQNMEPCWLCGNTFSNKAELHVHVVSKAHKGQTVICPWCFGEERPFTRVADLAVHSRNKHLVETCQLTSLRICPCKRISNVSSRSINTTIFPYQDLQNTTKKALKQHLQGLDLTLYSHEKNCRWQDP